ncbi:hypothetical protein CVT24_002812, partial [Panaeolus cyanescens]
QPVHGIFNQEVRIEDYISAYQTTGRPPAPCPPEPTDVNARKALNLPPLFVPHQMTASGPQPVTLPSDSSSAFNFSSGASTGSALALPTPTKPKITNPAEIPAAQEFTPKVIPGASSSGGNETFQSMSGMDEYLFFSLEELRCYAYARGQKMAPPGIKMDPFVVLAKETTAGTTVPGSNETLECISANPLYDKHSPEELRIAFLLSRREMTSAELIPGLSSVLPPITPSTTTTANAAGTTPLGLIPPATPLHLGGAATTTPLQLGSPVTPLHVGSGAGGLGGAFGATPTATPPVHGASLFGVASTTPAGPAPPKFSFNFR